MLRWLGSGEGFELLSTTSAASRAARTNDGDADEVVDPRIACEVDQVRFDRANPHYSVGKSASCSRVF
ncbi:hypothetical protein B7486_17100 [cyanobacterium TDX16]|nr:hypothetical protein B7486_17100 [cyanobacterium TDX16]